MQDGTREVKTGSEVVNTAGQAFGQIAGGTGIWASMQEMAASSQYLAQMAQELEDAVKQFSV
jgi:methyl-accepting chemotaxis protein